jgi:hypothetical protein
MDSLVVVVAPRRTMVWATDVFASLLYIVVA